MPADAAWAVTGSRVHRVTPLPGRAHYWMCVDCDTLLQPPRMSGAGDSGQVVGAPLGWQGVGKQAKGSPPLAQLFQSQSILQGCCPHFQFKWKCVWADLNAGAACGRVDRKKACGARQGWCGVQGTRRVGICVNIPWNCGTAALRKAGIGVRWHWG